MGKTTNPDVESTTITNTINKDLEYRPTPQIKPVQQMIASSTGAFLTSLTSETFQFS